jgi:O-antigen ligase
LNAFPRQPAARLDGPRPSGQQFASSLILASGAITVAVFGALIALGIIFRKPDALLPLSIIGAAAILLIAAPSWIVPAFIAITWAALPGHIFGGLPSPVEVGGLVLLFYAAWRAFVDPPLAGQVLLITFLLAVPLLVSGMLSPDGTMLPGEPLHELLFFVIAALCVVGTANVERVAIALTVIGLVLGLGAISSILIGPSEIFPIATDVATAIAPEAPRAAGPFGEPNFFALSLASLAPLALYVVTFAGWKRWLGIATLIAIAGGILAAGSRGAGIAMIFALVVVGIFTPNRALRTTAVATVVAALCLLPFFAAQANSSSGRSIEGRATENRVAFAMFEANPIAGVGPGQFSNLYRNYSRKIGDDPRPYREPHSLPLQIAAEQGLVGIIGWLTAAAVVIAYTVRRGVWRKQLGRAFMFSICTYLVGSLFLHGSQLRLLFILAGVALAFGAAEKVEAPSADREAPS